MELNGVTLKEVTVLLRTRHTKTKQKLVKLVFFLFLFFSPGLKSTQKSNKPPQNRKGHRGILGEPCWAPSPAARRGPVAMATRRGHLGAAPALTWAGEPPCCGAERHAGRRGGGGRWRPCPPAGGPDPVR